MKRLVIVLFILLWFAVSAFAGTIPMSGTIRLANGNLFTGSVRFILSYSAAQDFNAGNIVVASTVQYAVNNGVLPSNAKITPNDTLSPANTWYTAQYISSAGALVAQNTFYITGQSFNLGTATPTPVTTSNISFNNLQNLDIITAKNINNIRYCNQFPGANAGARIAACIADLPSTGGTADARGLQGAQSITADFWTGVTKPGLLLLGAGIYTTSVCLNIPTQWELAGTSTQQTTLKATGTPGCILGGVNQNHEKVHIRDLFLDASSIANTTAIDLSNSMTGQDCQNKIGPNVLIGNTTLHGINMQNCGGSDTWISHVDIGLIQGGDCINWHNSGGNNIIETVTCFPALGSAAPVLQRYGVIRADAQIVSISNSSFFGFESTGPIPTLNLSADYIYPGPMGAPIVATMGNSITTLNVFTGTIFGLILADSIIDGPIATMNLNGMSFANGSATGMMTSNFFGINFGSGSSLPAIINADAIEGASQDTTVVWNPPASPGSIVNMRGVYLKIAPGTSANYNYHQGPFSVGANPDLTGGSHIEVHSPTDSFLELFNTSGTPSDYIIDATNSNGLNIANRRAAQGLIDIDPGSTGTGLVNIPNGNFAVAGNVQFQGGVVLTAGTGVPGSACATGGNPGLGSLYVRSDAPDASHLWYVCTAASTWTALTIP